MDKIEPDGLYVNAVICGIEMKCLIDTGASVSVLHLSTYQQMLNHNRPQLCKSNTTLYMANGAPVEVHGSGIFNININGHIYRQQMSVAEIEAPAVIGYDFLKNQNCQIDIGKSRLNLDGKIVECILESTLPSMFRIRVAENTTVPCGTEMIVPATVDGALPHITKGMIECEKLQNLNGLLLAKTIVDPCDKIVPIRVMNVTDKPQVLYENTHVATCHAINHLEVLQRETTETLTSDQTELPTHLQPVWESCKENLSASQASKVKNLLVNHSNVFAKDKDDLGRTDIAKHKINTGDTPPIKQAPRRLPLSKKEIMKTEIDRMLKQGIIEPSQSPWSSPIVLVTKKDGSTRFCVDYRKLNNVTYKDSYPLPKIDESLDALRGSKWFSTLDLQSGYFQVEMDPQDAEKTAFTTTCGLFQFKVLSFGLCNAPATFERMMESVLSGLHWETCLLYIDDVIVFGDSFDQHLQRVADVLDRLGKVGLKVSPTKCQLFKKQVSFLGHTVSEEGISTDPNKISAVEHWSAPKNLHDLRSFLGLCSYYRRFVEGFATIAKPLHRLTEKSRSFLWTQECQESFEKLKQALITAPILCYPTTRENFVLDTDASGVGIGAVLSQQHDGVERVVAYFSKTLTKHERNYCITRKELLAVIEAVKHFHHYIYGVPVLVRTDHGALTWLLNFKNIEGQMARWLETLGEYDLKIQHRVGRKHMNADGLSRLPCDNCQYCDRQEKRGLVKSADSIQNAEPNNEVSNTETLCAVTTRAKSNQLERDDNTEPHSSNALSVDPNDVKAAQMNDSVISIVYNWISNQGRPEYKDISHMSAEVKCYWAKWDSLTVRDGLLYRRLLDAESDGETFQLVIPACLRARILTALHNDITAGHMGVSRTTARIQERYYWVNLREDVKSWCSSCKECQKIKNSTNKPKAQLASFKAGAPMERIAVDILGPLPVTKTRNKYILVVADYFTKWTESFPMPNIEAETVAKIIVTEFLCRFGLPRQIHTDQGTQFESRLFQEMCLLLDIDKTRTTPYHPQSNGLVERFNRTVLGMLTKYVSADRNDWDEKLPFLMMAYRSSIHESTGYTPSRMMLGREAELPIDLLFGPPPASRELEPTSNFVANLKETLTKVHTNARSKLLKASEKQKRGYDHRLNQSLFNAGDLVWLQTKSNLTHTPKLQFGWEGPYTVLLRVTDLVYKIQKSGKAKPRIVHHNVLKPYIGGEARLFD